MHRKFSFEVKTAERNPVGSMRALGEAALSRHQATSPINRGSLAILTGVNDAPRLRGASEADFGAVS